MHENILEFRRFIKIGRKFKFNVSIDDYKTHEYYGDAISSNNIVFWTFDHNEFIRFSELGKCGTFISRDHDEIGCVFNL
jgi:hypothetical protein